MDPFLIVLAMYGGVWFVVACFAGIGIGRAARLGSQFDQHADEALAVAADDFQMWDREVSA